MVKWIAPIAVLVLVGVASAADDGQRNVADARQGRLKVNNDQQSETKCGSLKVVAARVEECARVLVQILDGTVPKWPREPNDMIPICNQFEAAEKCIRDTARQCLGGLKRTIVSTFASALSRTRKRECAPDRYLPVFKLVNCVEKNAKLAGAIQHNASDYFNIIIQQMPDLDKKTTHVCCMLDEVENNIKRGLGPKCPNDIGILTRMYRSVLEDVANLICRAPKCHDIFKGYKVRPSKNNEGVISLLIQVLFSIS